MDKFGIFKLLNSFYDYYEKNKSALGAKSSDDLKNGFETKPSPSRTENSFLSSLFGASKRDAVEKPADNRSEKPDEKSAPLKPPPLKNSMLSVMNEHERFVSRVLKDNPNKPKNKT